MRAILLTLAALLALAPLSARGQTPIFHNSGASHGYSPNYTTSDSASDSTTDAPRYHNYCPSYSRPVFTFYYYPKGIPSNLYDPKTPGYRYYPYHEFRSSYPTDSYNRNRSGRYPVR